MEELHQDGGRHWHVFVQFAKSIATRIHDQWDVEGIHPNIAVAKNGEIHLMRLWVYMTKSGQPWGPWCGPTETVGKFSTSRINDRS